MPMILDGTNGAFLPTWTTGTRPASPANGEIGYNSTTAQLDQYVGGAWSSVPTGTTAISNGTSNVTVNSSGGTITAATNGTTAITISTAQNVTLAGKLDVTKRATFAAPASFDAISASTGTVEAHTLYGNALAGNGSSYDLMLLNRSGQEALGVVANTQNVRAAGTLSVGGATPSTSGAGITFPATVDASSNANTLDDYEEGTYTPSIQNFTVSGATTLTGSYTRIGNLVSFNVTFTNTGTIAHSASALISTPFNSGLQNSGAINMWINTNGYAFNSNQSGTQLNTGETNFDRFFVGSFTTTSAGQQLLFAGTYRITP